MSELYYGNGICVCFYCGAHQLLSCSAPFLSWKSVFIFLTFQVPFA